MHSNSRKRSGIFPKYIQNNLFFLGSSAPLGAFLCSAIQLEGFKTIVSKKNMALNTTLNPQYEEIGKGFVQQYYAFFDDPEQRQNLIHLYNVSKHQRKFGVQFRQIYLICSRICAEECSLI